MGGHLSQMPEHNKQGLGALKLFSETCPQCGWTGVAWGIKLEARLVMALLVPVKRHRRQGLTVESYVESDTIRFEFFLAYFY